jgi:hypothetical protein
VKEKFFGEVVMYLVERTFYYCKDGSLKAFVDNDYDVPMIPGKSDVPVIDVENGYLNLAYTLGFN